MRLMPGADGQRSPAGKRKLDMQAGARYFFTDTNNMSRFELSIIKTWPFRFLAF